MATTERPVMDAESALGFLAQASGVLAGSLDYERTLAEVAGLAVPDVADWCAVDIVDADGELRQITSSHPDAEQEALLMELRRRYREEKGAAAGATYAILTGDPILASDVRGMAEITVRDEEREAYDRLGPKSYMIVPLTARGRTIGALTFLSTRAGRHYTGTDLEFAQHLARRFALAIDNARLYDDAERARAMLDTLFRSVPVGLAFLDRELRCVRANDALSALSGAPEPGCVGRPLHELMGGSEPTLEPLARRVLETAEPLIEHELETGGRHWLLSLTPIAAADGSVAGLGLVTIDVTARRELLERERAAARRSDFLARAGGMLESSLDYTTALRNITRLAVPEIADWCAIHTVDDAGVVRLAAVAHAEPERERFAWELEERFPYTGKETSGPVSVVRSGRTEVSGGVTDELLRGATVSDEHFELARGLGLRDSIAVPLRARGRTLGAMTFVVAESDRVLDDDDRELV
ncbi:MAG: hypothetical protein QOG63_1746, partial [Thermoleophilaceae bacterium]|nr:hypothetical protein [Thermoleophilaceae bacterium]